MKHYEFGTWGLAFIWTLEGSVFPKALAWALPNAALAVFLWYVFNEESISNISIADVEALRDITTGQSWVGYNWVLGFLVSFRATRAYARWWEGGTLLQQARGEWFNAYSSLIAFCTDKPELKPDVDSFQQLLARLISMLYGAALQTVSMSENLNFELIDFTGVDRYALLHLLEKPDKVEIIIQWIQRLIVTNINNGVVPIAPPILSRAFQELSRGVVNMHNVRKITEFQFPFPFAQMITTMLLVQWLVTPFALAMLVGSPIWAGLLSFIPVFAFWGINYIAAEIEQPFGDDSNDMPMVKMQSSMNASILALLEPSSQNPPSYTNNTNLTTVESRDTFSQATTSVTALTEALQKLRRQTLANLAIAVECPGNVTPKASRRDIESNQLLRSVRFSETEKISITQLLPSDATEIGRSSTGDTASVRSSLRQSLRHSYVVSFSPQLETRVSSIDHNPPDKEKPLSDYGSGGSESLASSRLTPVGAGKKGKLQELRFDVPNGTEDVFKRHSSDSNDFYGSSSLDVRAYRVPDLPDDQLLYKNAPLRTIQLSPGRPVDAIHELGVIREAGTAQSRRKLPTNGFYM